MFSIYGSLPGAVSRPALHQSAVQGEQFQAPPQSGALGRPSGAPGPQRDPVGSLRGLVPGQLWPRVPDSFYGFSS